jgi:peptide chain release factor 2
MDQIIKTIERLRTEIKTVATHLKIPDLQAEVAVLDKRSTEPNFWKDTALAREIMKRKSRLEVRVRPWRDLQDSLTEVAELAALGDESIAHDLSAQLETVQRNFETLKEQLKFAGTYDGNDVILNIFAGAGGADAQDWAHMLMRMYVRWAEKSGYDVAVIDESPGEEGGIKSVTLEIAGDFVYGKLKGEHGVHRLVRLSPFNPESRETSFAKVDVLPKIDRPEDLAIDEKDLRIDVYRAGGHGGQSVNTTDSAVRLTHAPTGITVAIQNERSQLQNKEVAMTILRSRLVRLQIEQHQEKISELKGPNQSAEWGNQIRNYVLHPYKQVKDLRSLYETSDPESVLDGNLDPLIAAYLEASFST